MKRNFLICPTCGNLMELIQNGGQTPTCCNQKMRELIANTTEAANEKHIPVVDIKDNIANVTVGAILHPMEENHFIAWIYLVTNMGIKRVNLTPKEEPKASFALLPEEEIIEALAYCNLHSLWTNNAK